jgi:sugar O-acyltransferase (sialic acid O-acetyltransferase NeuD family)
MAKVVVFGTGQWAELAHFYLTHDSEHDVVAFTVDGAYLKEPEFHGLPVVDYADIEAKYPPSGYKMFIPMSFKRMNHLRAEKYSDARQRGYELISYVHSTTITYPGFEPGDNCFILEGNIIQPFVKIGSDVVMWTANHVGHHTEIKDHVMVTSNVCISGAVTIEPYVFIGVGATIRDEVTVAQETLVGMDASIAADTKEFEIYRHPGTTPAAIKSNRLRSISYKSSG